MKPTIDVFSAKVGQPDARKTATYLVRRRNKLIIRWRKPFCDQLREFPSCRFFPNVARQFV